MVIFPYGSSDINVKVIIIVPVNTVSKGIRLIVLVVWEVLVHIKKVRHWGSVRLFFILWWFDPSSVWYYGKLILRSWSPEICIFYVSLVCYRSSTPSLVLSYSHFRNLTCVHAHTHRHIQVLREPLSSDECWRVRTLSQYRA
jgi:hypothetical protein